MEGKRIVRSKRFGSTRNLEKKMSSLGLGEVMKPRNSDVGQSLVVANTRVNIDDSSIEMFEEGIKNVVRLEGEIDERVVDMASDFENFVRNEIWTVCHAINLKLSEKKETKDIHLSGLSRTFESIKNILKLKKNPQFLRYDRVDVFYIPLYHIGGTDDKGNEIIPPKMKISLVDTSNKMQSRIGGVTFNGNEMHASFFSMNFSVRSSQADCIKIMIECDKVPIVGRDYCHILMLMHVDGGSMCTKLEVRDPLCITINNVPAPENINAQTVIRTVKNSLSEKKVKQLEKAREKEEMRKERISEKIPVEIVAGEPSAPLLPEIPLEGQAVVMKAEKIPITNNKIGKEEEEKEKKGEWIIDSGASTHIMYVEGIRGPDKMRLLGGKEVRGRMTSDVTVLMCGELIHLGRVFQTGEERVNILSLGALQSENVVDEVSLSEGKMIGKKDKDVVFCALLTENNLYKLV